MSDSEFGWALSSKKVERFDDVIARLHVLEGLFEGLRKLHRTAMKGHLDAKRAFSWKDRGSEEERNELRIFSEVSQEYATYLHQIEKAIVDTIALFRHRWQNKPLNAWRWLPETDSGWRNSSAKRFLELLLKAHTDVQSALETYNENKWYTSQPNFLASDVLVEAIKTLTPPQDRDLAKLRAAFDVLVEELNALPGKLKSYVSRWAPLARTLVDISENVANEFVSRLDKWGKADPSQMFETNVQQLSSYSLTGLRGDATQLLSRPNNDVPILMAVDQVWRLFANLVDKATKREEGSLEDLEGNVTAAEMKLEPIRQAIRDLESIAGLTSGVGSDPAVDVLRKLEVTINNEISYHKMILALAQEIVDRINNQYAVLTQLRELIVEGQRMISQMSTEQRKAAAQQQYADRCRRKVNVYLSLATPWTQQKGTKGMTFRQLVRYLAQLIKKEEVELGQEHTELRVLQDAGLMVAA